MTAPVPRRLLLVSGSLGGGHHAAARAFEEQARLAWPGVEVARADALAGMGPGAPSAFRGIYAGCLRRLPWLYALYFWLLTRVPPFRAGTRAVLGVWSARSLRAAVDRHRPDVVVATIPEAVQGLARLRRRGLLPMTAVVLVADPAPHPLWVDAALDLHLVSTAEGAALARRVDPRARVRVGALPVVAAFRPPAPRPPRGRPLAYVSCGSFAFGDVPAACAAVLAGGGDVLVGCGRDAGLRGRLLELARAHPGRVDVRDWVDDPVAATRDCDLVVTNAGGATALEALACARALLLFDPVPGHGRANAAVLADAGAARICRTPAELAAAVAAPPPPAVAVRRDAGPDLAAVAGVGAPRPGPRVRPADALFLHVAGPAQQMGAVAVLPDPARRDDWPRFLADRVARRAPGIELLCRRLAPPRRGRPLRWVVDPAPDPARHVRPDVLVVQPRGRGFSAALAAHLATPLDPGTSAWELQVARDGDDVAILLKLHHALGDGIAAVAALAELLVDRPAESEAAVTASTVAGWAAPGPAVAGRAAPGPAVAGRAAPGPAMAGRAAAGPAVAGRAAPGPAVAGWAAAGPAVAARAAAGPEARALATARIGRALRATRGVAGLARAGLAGPTPFRAGGPTRWAGLTLDGRLVRAAARAHGVGTSVLVVAALAEALHAVGPEALRPAERVPQRTWSGRALERVPAVRVGAVRRGSRRARERVGAVRVGAVRVRAVRVRAVRVMVPVSARTGGAVGAFGNRTAAVPVDLPIGNLSPAERLQRVAAAMERAVRTHRPAGASCALAALGLLPTPLQRVAARHIYGPPFFHAIASVMPGVRRTLSIRGAPLVSVHPALPLADRVGLAVGVLHWRETTTVGITASDPALADALPAALERAVATFAAAAPAGGPRTGSGSARFRVGARS